MSQAEMLYCLNKSREKQMLIEQIDRERWKERCQHKQNMVIHCYPQWISYAHKCASDTNYGNKTPRGTNCWEAQADRQTALPSPLEQIKQWPLPCGTVHTEVYKPPPHEKGQILIQRWEYIRSYQASWLSQGSQGQQAVFWLLAFTDTVSQQ